MTLMMAELEATAQALVDARLDTIDRMLVGRVPRADRLAIVREVEAQIFELLPADEPGPIDRAAILAVLRRLDPPEAYLPDASEAIATPGLRTSRPVLTTAASRSGQHQTALWSGILGIGSIVGSIFLPILSWGMAMLFNSVPVLMAASILSAVMIFAMAIVAIVLGVRSRRTNGWGMAGLVTGIVGCVLGLLFCGGMLFVVMSM